jgi:hypothetical protein
VLLPDSIELKIQVPLKSRTSAFASFDGRHRIELQKGDYIVVTMSRFPMPSACLQDQSADWFESLRRCLHWNERARQAGLEDDEAEIAGALEVGDEHAKLDELAKTLFPSRNAD